MEQGKQQIQLKIRRYDLSDTPQDLEQLLELPTHADHNNIKNEIVKLCGITLDTKVIKTRNQDEVLVPLSFLSENPNECYFVDVSNICLLGRPTTSLLQDAYVDAVCQKVKNLESRVAQTELLLPQLEWRRQVYMEETVSALANKVAFLNRRFDELAPKQTWYDKFRTGYLNHN